MRNEDILIELFENFEEHEIRRYAQAIQDAWERGKQLSRAADVRRGFEQWYKLQSFSHPAGLQTYSHEETYIDESTEAAWLAWKHKNKD